MDTPSTERMRINYSWLLKLRWAAGVGQLLTVVTVRWGLGIPLPLDPLFLLIGIEVVSNILLELDLRRRRDDPSGPRFRPAGERLLGMVMTFDIGLLTCLLGWTGGPNNPFCLFYLVNLTLAAVLLPPRWAWWIAGWAAACSALLFLQHEPLPALGNVVTVSAGNEVIRRTPEQIRILGQGMFVAFTVAVAIITYFITRVTSDLARRERELSLAQRRKAESEKLEALATLAAGAAHELASPLSTIAIVAKELERQLESCSIRRRSAPVAGLPQAALTELCDDAVIEDARLIRHEVARCREILDHMATDAGESTGELNVWMTVAELVAAARNGLREAERVEVDLPEDVARVRLQAPRHALAQAIRGLFKNGLDATPEDRPIRVTAVLRPGRACIVVRDSGAGMAPETLARIGNPFFTTKEPGRGMGLGVFLARKVIERLGGECGYSSSLGRGTECRIELPADLPAAAP